MKRLVYIAITFQMLGCSIEDPSACFEQSGGERTKTISLENFSRVIVREGILLEVQQGNENKMAITHGKNFLDNITAEIIGGRLNINNNNECKFFNGYKPAKVVLTATDIVEIRNASQYTISSTDTIRFNSLTLISEDFNENEVNVGDFDILINNQNMTIVTNDVSNFLVAGKTENFNVTFASGQGKLLADKLEAQRIFLFHRGTNNLLVHPIQEITGEIRGTGNAIATNRPPSVSVEEFYTGRLIFRD